VHHAHPLDSPPAVRGAAALRRVLAPLLVPILLTLAALWLSRLGLAIWQAERIGASGAWRSFLAEGLRFDGVLLGMAWAVPAALTPWMAMHPALFRGWTRVLRAWGLVVFLFVVFMEVGTPSFIHQYDSRPNYLFVEYLQHYREVGGTLIAEHPLQLLVAAIGLPLLGWGFWRLTGRVARAAGSPRVHPLGLVVLSAVLLVAFAAAGRGSLGHRAANPALAAVGTDHLVNELPLSSAYTVLYAVYQNTKNADGGADYGRLPESRVLEIVRGEMAVADTAFTDPARPTLHRQVPTAIRERPVNLVIVLEESLGAEFVGSLGGLPLTPNLDRLAREGIWFENLYATGTRSVRGIEAVVSGFPPTSTNAVVKQSKSQRGFFTLAGLLKAQGYDTSFFYGGESHFDNMRGFFMGNGFERVVDQKDMADARFMATWGASDGDVFAKAHEAFLRQPRDKPFFSLIFTSSNHAPFEFPDGGFTLHEQPKATVNNAVKYADHALGVFIEQARQSPYWADTLFLVVADHNSRVYGDSVFPVERFHIPGLIVGGPVRAPQSIGTLASQLDLIPTLVSLMGLEVSHPGTGRDLTRPEQRARPGRAIMQFDQLQAYREGDRMVVLQPGVEPRTLAPAAGQWRLVEPDAALAEKAIAHAQFAKWAYARRWH
jgi:phosphoglycerol transferase MdoB-like AlkP superfamily enzyme